MSGKFLLAVCTAVALSIAGVSVSQASDNSGEYSGGFKVGPLGQVLGSPRSAERSFSYYVPLARPTVHKLPHKK